MRTFTRLTVPLLTLALLLAGCGGNTPTQHAYRTPYGTQAHSLTFGLPPAGSKPRPSLSSVPTLLMLDSTDHVSVFSGLRYDALAGYTSGFWPTYSEFRAQVHHTVAVMVNTSHTGVHGAALSCLDVEPGDATPSEAGPWLAQEVKLGFKPCAYGSLSEWPAINQSIASSHITVHVYRWDAEWTYQPHLSPGFDATQWTDHYLNRNIDATQATRAFLNLVVHPKPKPQPVVCFGAHRQHTAVCDGVRQQAVVIGRARDQQRGYVTVSKRNLALIEAHPGRYLELRELVAERRLAVETQKASVLNHQLESLLGHYGYQHK